MSFYEKSAWGSLVIVLLAFGGYAAVLLATGWGSAPAAFLLLGVVVAVVVAEAAYHIAIAVPLWRHPEDAEMDERDRLIEWRAESAGGTILGVVVVVVIGYLVIREAFFPPAASLLAAHLLIAGLVAAEAFKYARQIVFYRRGI